MILSTYTLAFSLNYWLFRVNTAKIRPAKPPATRRCTHLSAIQFNHRMPVAQLPFSTRVHCPKLSPAHRQHAHATTYSETQSLSTTLHHSPLNADVWRAKLQDEHDSEFLLNGIMYGFHLIPPETIVTPAQMTNYRSATSTKVRDKVERQIREEIQQRNHVITEVKPAIVSALGAIPKPNTDRIRLIHDCSRPEHGNLNSYTTTQHFSYVTLDKAVSRIYLAKIDLKSAYRHVPIHPSNYNATGLAWQFSGETHLTFMYDSKLPFGASKSPEIFHRVTQAITRWMTRRGFHTVLAYVLTTFLS